MDHAVSLVQAYLQINGYFTVAEYPVIEAHGHGNFRMATDLDILAFRFPGAGRMIAGEHDHILYQPDPALNIADGEADMLIGEIKEGRAELNQNTRDPAILEAALARFGCCSVDNVEQTVRSLLSKGKAVTSHGHRVRLVAFGSITSSTRHHAKYQCISLGHINDFIEAYLEEHWEVLRQAQFKHPALGLLMLIKKARQGNKNRGSGT